MQVPMWPIILIICAYFMVLLGAIMKSRFTKTGRILPTADEFFLADRKLNTPVLVATFIGSLFSAYTVVGVPAATYGQGVAALVYLLLGATIFSVSTYFFGRYFLKKYRELGDAFSPVEVISRHFDSKSLGVLIAVMTLIFLIPYLSLQLVGMGKLLFSFSDGEIGYLTGVGFIMLTIILYLMFGGMRAVAYTDFVQAILIFVGIVGSVYLFVQHFFGGVGQLIAEVTTHQANHLSIAGPDGSQALPMLISIGVFIGFLTISQPQALTRFMMATKQKQIVYMALILFLLSLVGYGGGALIGIGGAVLYPDLAEPNLVSGQVLSALMAVNWFGLIVAGMLLLGVIAASMSTADSLLLAIGQVFTRDIARPYIELKHETQVIIAKVVMILILIAAFWIGLSPPPVMIDLASYSFMGTGIMVPVFITMGWKYRCKYAAFAAIALGEATFIGLLLAEIKPLGFHPSFAGLVVSALIVLAGGLVKYAQQRKA